MKLLNVITVDGGVVCYDHADMHPVSSLLLMIVFVCLLAACEHLKHL